ncbi:MAG: ATP-dependent sacrificial sulfur transferase LarE [archaeon]|nr:ATP-dependent sacrificial sulfur transferase LarE [archaeon]
MPSIGKEKLEELRREIGEKENLLVAFSGGVDSSFLLKVAHDVLGKERVLAVTVDSELFSRRELADLKEFLKHTDIPHKIVQVSWQRSDDFVRNPYNRCYYCKRECARLLKDIAAKEGITTIAEGVTASDIDEHRPGIAASREGGIWHPLVEVGITKDEVRYLAKEIGLPFWAKPTSPCLATRIEYGERITEGRLKMIEAAEDFLNDVGFKQLRVRLHHSGIARIEVDKKELDAFCDTTIIEVVCQKLKALGFNYVTLDLEGYRSGSMDDAHPPVNFARSDNL